MTSMEAGPEKPGAVAEEMIRQTVRAAKAAFRTPTTVVCERLHISRATWFNKLRGDTSFTAGEVAELSSLWGVRVADFFEGRLVLPSHRSGGPDADENLMINRINNLIKPCKSGGTSGFGGLLRGGSSKPVGRPAARHLRLVGPLVDQSKVSDSETPGNDSVALCKSPARRATAG